MSLLPAGDTDGSEPGGVGASDEELLSGHLRGNKDMFDELVRRYQHPLHAFICRVTGPGEAWDLFQESFMQVYRNADRFGGRGSFKTWLYAIALNTCRAYLRKHRRKETVSERAATYAVSNCPDPGSVVAKEEVDRRIADAVAELPEDQREVVFLRTSGGLSFREIAEALGLPLATAKSRMRLALSKLRAQLHEIAKEV